jgi:hypothetical protein
MDGMGLSNGNSFNWTGVIGGRNTEPWIFHPYDRG